MFDLQRFTAVVVVAAMPAMAADNSMIVEREAPSVAGAAGAVERDGTKLVLHLTSGKTRTLTDGPSCFDESQERQASSCYGYEFVRYEKARHAFVVEQYYYEGADHVIVDDRTGALTLLQSDPYFSPNGNVALELVYGESHYYSGEPRVSIWHRRDGKFVREWSKPLDDGGSDGTYFTVVGWRSNDHVDLEAVRSSSWNDDGGTRRFSIARTTNGWQVLDR